jgi:transposase-like protein
VSPPQVPDELAREAVKALEEFGDKSAAARALGIARSTYQNRLKRAAERGLMGYRPVLPGYAIKGTTTERDADGHVTREWVRQAKEAGGGFAMPPGHIVKGVSAYLDPDGRILGQWVKTREDRGPLETAELIKEAFADFVGTAQPSPVPPSSSEDLLTLVPLADWHIGMFSWGKETGANWDLKIAEDVIGRGIESLIDRTPASSECVILGGGDLLHSDNNENRTARSGNALNVDGRYQKVLMAACRLVVRTIDAALRRHKHVTVRILPGNHDEHSSVAVSYFLLAWYRNEPRITVNVDPSLFFWKRFGLVMLGATHGHTVKIEQMASIMAHRRPEDWGATRYRFVHGFHWHHSRKMVTEGGGVVSEIHQTPIPQDAWHFGAGFLSGRSMQAITYHAAYGEVSRCRDVILDAEMAA